LASARERKKLHELVDGIVLAQGNAFIKELLRSKGLRIGATKRDFEQSLREAIDAGKLTLVDLHGWLTEIEGWGAHHIYLYRWEASRLTRPLPNNADELQVWLSGAELESVARSPQPFTFPTALTITETRLTPTGIQVVWHQGTESWIHVEEQDYEEVIDGDRYYFEAYRFQAERSVVRFVLRQDELAAVFIPTPLGPEHRTTHSDVMSVATRLLGQGALRPIDIGRAQLRLDAGQLHGDTGIKAARSRLRGQGAYVEFGSTSPTGTYADVDTVREVRDVATRGPLSGDSADLTFAATGKTDPIRVDLHANDRRVYIRAQISEPDEWRVLAEIAAV
jgi:hypothetical protein